MVSIAETDAALEARLKKKKADYGDYFEEEFTKGRATLFNSKHCLIRFYKTADINTIAHECFHMVTLLMDFIGLKFDLNHNDEAYAYLLGYLVEEIYKKI